MRIRLRLLALVSLSVAVSIFHGSCPATNSVATKKAIVTDVTIRFTGICTLYDPNGWKEIEESLALLLLNAEEPHSVLLHGAIHRHVPFITFDKDHLHDEHFSDLIADVNPKNGQAFRRYELRGEEVFLDPDANPQPAKLAYELTYVKKDCPSAGRDTASLHWFPSMSDVRQEQVSERNSYVETPDAFPVGVPHPDPAKIAARFIIDAGYLNADRFMLTPRKGGEKRMLVRWAFKQTPDSAPRHCQAMAQELIWTFKIPSKTLTLYRRRFEVPTQSVKLLTFIADEDDSIEIKIGNTLPGDILPPDRGSAPLMPRDVHFALYDRFVSNFDLRAVVPFSGEVCPAIEGIGAVDGLNCGPNRLP